MISPGQVAVIIAAFAAGYLLHLVPRQSRGVIMYAAAILAAAGLSLWMLAGLIAAALP